jgi:hypothetical protein
MRAFLFGVALVLVGRASAEPPETFGALRPGMNAEQAIAAAPSLPWNQVRGGTGALIGASAEGAVAWDGARWSAEIGDQSGLGMKEAFLFDLRRREYVADPNACRDLVSRTISSLEPVYGKFGRHPSFSRKDSTLYGTGPFAVRETGAGSRFRAYPLSDGQQSFSSFNEIDPSRGKYVMTTGAFFADYRVCELRIKITQSGERAARLAGAR